ncbi:entericidin A/B family lipoprotein [bacterium]|nr:entericidin A/B family lipoprotein [bacterium]
MEQAMRLTSLVKIALAGMIVMAVAGCGNTVRGAGADIERAGEKIQRCC